MLEKPLIDTNSDTMSRVSPTLPLSHIIAADAPILSPSSPSQDQYAAFSPAIMDNYAFYAHGFPPSPPHSAGSTGTNSPAYSHRMLRMHAAPDAASCIPTHQVFDVPEMQYPHSPESPSPSPQMYARSVSVSSERSSSKRELSPAPGMYKKARNGERVTTKDFIPPDVSGLSKREARLVKNRAAAFLSRQRKREEFETMEIRVVELEQENAVLRMSHKGTGGGFQDAEDFLSEIELLRTQLMAAAERERELSTRLQHQATEAAHAAIKQESADAHFPPSPASRGAASSPYKPGPGASLGLMVLLCALPTLLSMPTPSSLPPAPFSLPVSAASATLGSSHGFELASALPEQDWRNSGMMDLDDDLRTFASPQGGPRTLEFVDAGADALGLGNLDISFDAAPSDAGKIRVKINSPTSTTKPRSRSSSSLATWAGAHPNSFASPNPTHAYPHPSDGDPFFGVGSSSAFGLASPMNLPASIGEFASPNGYGSGLFNIGPDRSSSASGKRRVKISLKSMPTAAADGGEWEVEVR